METGRQRRTATGEGDAAGRPDGVGPGTGDLPGRRHDPVDGEGHAVPAYVPVMEGLRAYAADYTDLTHRLAAWLGVHSADALAFAEILYAEDKGTPLSPARLAQRISLTSGATTSLLNRLERAGLLVRSREHADRRIVTLRSVPAITAPARRFFEPLAQRVEVLAAEVSPETLAEFQRFLSRLHEAMADVSANLDELVGPRFPGPDGAAGDVDGEASPRR